MYAMNFIEARDALIVMQGDLLIHNVRESIRTDQSKSWDERSVVIEAIDKLDPGARHAMRLRLLANYHGLR